jgi:hypothetical protein
MELFNYIKSDIIEYLNEEPVQKSNKQNVKDYYIYTLTVLFIIKVIYDLCFNE